MPRYKVVRDYGSGYSSFSTVFNIDYVTGKWYKAPLNTGFLVFETLEQAKEFCRCNPVTFDACIFECKVRNPMKLPPNRLIDTPTSIQILKKFWSGKPVLQGCSIWPSGTKAYKFVKLDKLVTVFEGAAHALQGC